MSGGSDRCTRCDTVFADTSSPRLAIHSPKKSAEESKATETKADEAKPAEEATKTEEAAAAPKVDETPAAAAPATSEAAAPVEEAKTAEADKPAEGVKVSCACREMRIQRSMLIYLTPSIRRCSIRWLRS